MTSEPAIELTTAQRRRLQALLRDPGTTSRVHVRATVVLMTARGVSGEEIAGTLGITRRTVTNIRARWRAQGLRGLADRTRSGRPPRADAAYRRALRDAVGRDPRAFGYAFTRWTAPRLAAHLATRTGVTLSAAWVAALLRADDFVWRRTRHTLRNLQDPAAIARATRQLQRAKRGRSRRDAGTSCGSATA